MKLQIDIMVLRGDFMTNLKKLRIENGLTQEELCEKLSKTGFYLDRTTFSKYETGSRSIPVEALIAFASFFETTTDYILGLCDNKTLNFKISHQ